MSTLYEESLRLLEARKAVLDPDEYSFVFFGDTWVGENSYVGNDIFQSAMEIGKTFSPLFFLHGGDIVFTGKVENFNHFLTLKQKYAADMPFFITVGNHEFERFSDGTQSLTNFINMIGPLHFTLNLPAYKLTIISLNTMLHNVINQYGLTTEELRYLRDSLTFRQRNTFTMMHVPPRTDDWTRPDEVFTTGSEQFFDKVKGKITAALVSHVHAYDTDRYRHVDLILSGGGGATLNKKQIFHIIVFTVKNSSGLSRITKRVVPIGWD